MQAPINYNGEWIMVQGPAIFKVGMERDDSGRFIPDRAAVFESMQAAQAFVDAGKPADYPGLRRVVN